MDIRQYFKPDQVLVDVECNDKFELIDRLIDALFQGEFVRTHPGLTRDVVRDAVVTRERHASTGLENDLACPHARVPGITTIGMAMALLRSPIDFGEGRFARVVFLLVVPFEMPVLALKFIAQIAKLGESGLAASLMEKGRTPGDAVAFATSRLKEISGPLTAGEVMRKPIFKLGPETPLTQVVHAMVNTNLDAAGIAGPDGGIIGEITSDRLFLLGVPDFFNQLKSVGFISDFDPVEKYFEKEAQRTAGDVMSKDFAVVDEKATLLEVLFLLSVRRHAKAYVVRDGNWVGVIDRILLLDKIFNL